VKLLFWGSINGQKKRTATLCFSSAVSLRSFSNKVIRVLILHFRKHDPYNKQANEKGDTGTEKYKAKY